MAKQVQFYSVSKVTDATTSPNANGIYFVNASTDHGIIYKGGIPYANKVSKINTTIPANTGAIQGDIAIVDPVAVESATGASGASPVTYVFDGTSWVQLIQDASTFATAGSYLSANGTSVVGAIRLDVETSGGLIGHTELTLNTVDISNVSSSLLGNDMIPGAKSVVDYVDGKLSSFDNAMHFLGVGTVSKAATGGTVTVSAPTGTTPKAGDIVIDATTGLEAIKTSTGWELIGDNAYYALNAYTSTAKVYTGVTTVPGALNAAGASIDAAFTALSSKAQIGTSTSASDGVAVSISLYSNKAPAVAVTVEPSSFGLGGYSSSTSNGITVEVNNDEFARPTVTVTASAAPNLAGTPSGTDTVAAGSTTAAGVAYGNGTVATVGLTQSANGKITAVTVSVNDTQNLNFTSPNGAKLATEAAVVDALCWLGANGKAL